MTETITRKKHAGGRPLKTLGECMPAGWQDIIYEMSSNGASDVEIKAHLCMMGGKFSNDTWDRLKACDVEFSETCKKGKMLCQAWWEKYGREHLYHGKDSVFETGLWTMNMKNRFGWKDKTDIEHSVADETLEKFKEMSNQDIENRIANLTRCPN